MSTLTKNESETAKTDEVLTYAPAADIYETPEGYVVTVDLPGVDREDVAVTLHENALSVEGTRHGADHDEAFGRTASDLRYARSFQLGRSVDQSKIDGELSAGVLTVRLSKVGERVPKTIEVTAY